MSTAIGIIGGTGLYNLEGLQDLQSLPRETPFGLASSGLMRGRWQGRDLLFLPRHGSSHELCPHEINHRANIYALRSHGVRFAISVSSVGSLQEQYAPGDAVLVDQFFDRNPCPQKHSFYGNGVVGHVSFGQPVSADLRKLLYAACVQASVRVHQGGTYVHMAGPAFSTLAESNFYRHCGFDVIGMTNMAEAKLAREAGIAYASLAMITDYDCWKDHAVTTAEILGQLASNAKQAKEVLQQVIAGIPLRAEWPEHAMAAEALLTPFERMSSEQQQVFGLLCAP